MNKRLKILAIAVVATLCLNGAAAGQTTKGKTVVTTTTTTTSNADSTVTRTTTTTKIDLDSDILSDLLRAAAKNMHESTKGTLTGLKATVDTSLAKNADALREIIKVDAQTANQILDMLNVVADSVATCGKRSIGTTKRITADVANRVNEAVKRGVKEMEEEANKRNEALADSMKRGISAVQSAIDELVKELEEDTSAQK